ncbi:hypothetical protein G7B40_036030 [Aetokthonos hydrillicola Thurmond2011]|uniref:Uncharacterized protein n=1 Tax=Aetokthonos hydrillicola Thurmond2011 TaxID=2712845 RepID=A0AAP5IEA2_9CYAN|nr:hypothetical protein [Aetokthonos hydrillicola]MBW4586368.1 hypothetical protein [Aetokthonos hydrillicola CCALA 1050]MDR9899926.1 hypothetical protein [Aetokthonos hydrillicola Thurmond2011]
MNENFNINLVLTPPNLDPGDVDNPTVRVNDHTRWLDQGYETQVVEKRDFWHWFGLIPKKEIISRKRPDKKENYYTVSLEEIVEKSNTHIPHFR